MSFGLLPSLSGTRILPGSFGNIVNRAFGVGPPVGGGYTTGGVSFNGIDTMLDLAALAASNSPFLSFSYWYQYPGNMAAPIWAIDPAGDDFMQDFGTVGPTPFVADEPFAGNRLEFDLTGSPAFNVWHGAQICMNVNHAAGARPHSVWVDDVNMTNDVFDDGIAFTLTPNGFRMTIGSDTFGSFLAGNIADFWWGQGQFIDFSILALRRKFISAAGKPVDLGTDGSTPTGIPPTMFLRRAPLDPAAAFAVDRSGNGNTLTINGTLGISPTSPTD